MNFARKQLEKYGWTDGKGLGKNENGISEALKPKLKRSVAGIGYDAAADFTEHWWSALYDKAAKNVEVEEKNGKTKKMKCNDNNFEITNSTWRLKHKPNDKNTEEYSDFFVKTAVLDVGGAKTVKVKDNSDSENEGDKDVTSMTDKELFKACEGRTAHKGARHGLRALGKLARIEQQEQLLLQQAKYSSYLQKQKNTSDLQVVEDTSLEDEVVEKKKKRKKKKHCNSNENEFNTIEISEDNNISRDENQINAQIEEDKQEDNSDCFLKNKVDVKKKKRKHKQDSKITIEPENQTEDFIKNKRKKKNK